MAAALTTIGSSRRLPDHILGLNSPVVYDIPHEDPDLIPAVEWLQPGLLRFPGGSVGNFFDWRTGQLSVPMPDGASVYRQSMAKWQGFSSRLHPNGCHMEDWARIAAAAGAEITLVANLESDTPESQGEWFARMADAGVVPARVELGNEFYLHLLGDTASKARFPDWKTTLDLSRDYVDAIRPHAPDSVFAVQAAASRLFVTERPSAGRIVDEWDWDDAMGPEDWFGAVIVHPYPELDATVGRGTFDGLPGTADAAVTALVAKVDGGFQRVFDFTADRMPGKDLWVTEWGPGVVGPLLTQRNPRFNGFWFHVVARGSLSLLRHPAVTVGQYHGLFCKGGPYAVFEQDSAGGYRPTGPAELLRWFHLAANGGATHERVHIDGAVRLWGGGPLQTDDYEPVEGALFTAGHGRRTLLVHNAGPPVTVDLGGVVDAVPTAAETCAVENMGAVLEGGCPAIRLLPVDRVLELPAWSVARIVW